MARIYLLLAVFCAGGCMGLQPLEEPFTATPLPALQSYPIPDRPVYSLDELEQETPGLAYSIEYREVDSAELQRLLSQRIYGWLRSIPTGQGTLPIFRIKPGEQSPSGYPYRLQIVVEPAEEQFALNGLLQHSPSGRSYPAFKRLFSMGHADDTRSGSDLAMFHGLSKFLDEGQGHYLSFPGEMGQELADWIKNLGTGRVRILSSQEADVRITNRTGTIVSSGRTPVDATLAAGAYEFYIKRKGMPPVTRSLIVRPAGREVLLLTWPDDESTSSLSVFTSPEELQIATDGTVNGDSPIAMPSVMPGDIKLEIAQREEGSDEAYVLRQSTVAAGDGQDLTRFYPFEYYIDFRRAEKIGSLWTSNQPLKSLDRNPEGMRIKTVRAHDGPPAGLLSQPLEAMNQKIRISLEAGSDWQMGLSTGPGGDRPMLRLQDQKVYFTPPASHQEVSPGVYSRPVAGEGQLDVIELLYIEETSNLELTLNGREIYDGPFQNTGYFRIYLAAAGAGVPVHEVEIEGGPYLGSTALSSVSSLFWDLGRFLGMNSRLRPLPE